MHISEAIDLVVEGCKMHMNQLDNDGYCAESDNYVVALSVFDDWMEYIHEQEEQDVFRELKENNLDK
tara:strand:+ start:61955 stop:62155 length:201 start_codon:yes stop_codon:yes gene_type:complete